MSFEKSAPNVWVYLEKKFVQLGAEALSRDRVYLDTNFLAILRDHVSGVRVRADASRFLTVLREGVRDGRLACVYSSHTICELMKHQDATARLATAKIVDELGSGFCLANQDRLLNNEIIHFIGGVLAPDMDRWPLHQLAWTRPFFLFIDYCPPAMSDNGDENIRVQKGFVDHVWDMPMAEVIRQINESAIEFPSLKWPSVAAESINSSVRDHDADFVNLHECYMSELSGMLAWANDRFVQRFIEFSSRYGIGVAPVGEQQVSACGALLYGAAMEIAQKKKLGLLLPSIHIRSALHAAIRFDKRRRFKPNDLMDIEHAETALPNCNYFFTDGPNAHLIRSAKLDSEFGCTVKSSLADALDAVSGPP